MFRSFLTVIIIVCATRIVFASSKNELLICGENEVLSRCVNRACGYRKCSEVGKPIECIMMSPILCKKGCICRDDYLRADNGTCILASQCPNALKCPKLNEYYDPCPPQCPSRTCAVMDNTTCPEPLQDGDPRCPPGSCRCNVGFYRDSNGDCVTWKLCNKCRENEIQTSCFEGRCERRECSDLGKPVVCVRIDPKFCTVGCLCQDGFLRADNGTCIPVNQCPEAQTCGDNEVFDICPPTCPGEQCGVDPSVVLCLPSPEPGDPSCQPSCRCRSRYLRNDNGTCIPQNQCPTECGANEVFDTCIAPCPRRRCDFDDSVIRCAAPPQPGDPACTAGCRCADNFFRNNESNCVPRNECPPLCGPNEVYSTCVKQCQQRRCDSISKVVICRPNQECQTGCRCIDNYLRNKLGFCVPRSQCEKDPPPPIRPPPKKYLV